MVIGASLAVEMFRVVDATPAPAARARTKMWSPASASWVEPTGVGARTLCNYLGAALAAAGLDDEVRIYDCGAGGSSISFWANPADNHWGASGALRANAMAQVAAGGVVPDIVGCWQGWQDFLCPLSSSYIRSAVIDSFDDLYEAFKAAWGSGLLFDVWPPGRCNYPPPAATSAPVVQSAQIAWALSTPGAALGVSNYDMPLRDGVHGTGAGYKTAGTRGGIAIAARLEIPGFVGIEVPRITAASRHGSTITLETNAAGSLFSINEATGFFVWDSAWAWVTITFARTMGKRIRIDLGSASGSHITYQRGIDADIAHAIYTKIKGEDFPLSPHPDENLELSDITIGALKLRVATLNARVASLETELAALAARVMALELKSLYGSGGAPPD